MKRYRDSHGRFASAYFFAQELKAGRVKLKYADGSRIRVKKQVFIHRIYQQHYAAREDLRQKRKYEKAKIEKITGRKIEKELVKPPKIEVVGKKGKVIKEEAKFIGGAKTYIRWSYRTRRVSGSDGTSARNAGVFNGRLNLKEVLNVTDFFYYINQDVPLIQSGELTFIDGGIHYYQYHEDTMGYRHIIAGTEHRIDGEAIMRV